MTATMDKELAKSTIQTARAQLGATSVGVSAQRPALNREARLTRRTALLEDLVVRHRERANVYELALAEIAGLTRKLTGDKTSKIYAIACEALNITEPEEPSGEAFE